jgi:GT2 family glycosyltransferase
MPRPLVSVVFATYQRGHLLGRSIECYNRSRFPLDRLEVVVVDDGSSDYTAPLMGNFHTAIDVKYVKLRKFGNVWRDCAAVINHGIRVSTGDVVVLTHPEVMPGRDSLQWCADAAAGRDGVYACCKPYYLSRRDQERIDTVDWVNGGPLAVRRVEGFYDDPEPGSNHAFSPKVVEQTPEWESWVFGGLSRHSWRVLGGMVETRLWGSVDLAFHMRRFRLGIKTATGKADDTICVHQNHDDPALNTPTPRDLNAAHAEAATVDMDPAKLVYPAVDHLW